MHKQSRDKNINLQSFVEVFALAVDAVKLRGKADVGEKTMLDVLIPVATTLKLDVAAGKTLTEIMKHACETAAAGVEATRGMLATKGRASFLGERSIGHIDPGAKTAQLMIEAITDAIKKEALPD